jgi:hypothetical protein
MKNIFASTKFLQKLFVVVFYIYWIIWCLKWMKTLDTYSGICLFILWSSLGCWGYQVAFKKKKI